MAYRNYRQAIEQKRIQKYEDGRGEDNNGPQEAVSDSEKYDPADILNEDDDEGIDKKDNDKTNASGNSQAQDDKGTYNPINSMTGDQDDSYDSDTEFRQEAKERNYANMKRKLDSTESAGNAMSFLGNQYDSSDEEEHMEMYQKIQMQETNDERNSSRMQRETARPYFQVSQNEQNTQSNRSGCQITDADNARKKKRSRWGEQIDSKPSPPALMSLNIPHLPSGSTPVLSTVTRTDAVLLAYARQNYGTTELSEEDWVKCEDHYKVNLLYQDMLRKRNEIDRLAKNGRFKYEYDSDEDVAGGTWEHKLRNAEMEATSVWADALTKQSEGRHHIGDFLPPEELKKFMEQYDSKKTNREPDLSDYKEYKLREDNKGKATI